MDNLKYLVSKTVQLNEAYNGIGYIDNRCEDRRYELEKFISKKIQEYGFERAKSKVKV